MLCVHVTMIDWDIMVKMVTYEWLAGGWVK